MSGTFHSRRQWLEDMLPDHSASWRHHLRKIIPEGAAHDAVTQSRWAHDGYWEGDDKNYMVRSSRLWEAMKMWRERNLWGTLPDGYLHRLSPIGYDYLEVAKSEFRACCPERYVPGSRWWPPHTDRYGKLFQHLKSEQHIARLYRVPKQALAEAITDWITYRDLNNEKWT